MDLFAYWKNSFNLGHLKVGTSHTDCWIRQVRIDAKEFLDNGGGPYESKISELLRKGVQSVKA